MGTNYYYHPSGERDCPHCGQRTPDLHIGKSSMGWCFSLRVHPSEGIASLDDWRARWMSGGAIFDEYGDRVTPIEMDRVIMERGDVEGLRSHVGLVSHAGVIPGGIRSRAQHGGQTYDLCDYEFS